jgi:hypothetical protein
MGKDLVSDIQLGVHAMNVMKRFSLAFTLIALSFGATVSVAPKSIYALASTPTAGDVIDLLNTRIAPLEDELEIIETALNDAPNPFVASLLMVEKQVLETRISSLEIIRFMAPSLDDTQLSQLYEVYVVIVSQDVPSVNNS